LKIRDQHEDTTIGDKNMQIQQLETTTSRYNNRRPQQAEITIRDTDKQIQQADTKIQADIPSGNINNEQIQQSETSTIDSTVVQ